MQRTEYNAQCFELSCRRTTIDHKKHPKWWESEPWYCNN